MPSSTAAFITCQAPRTDTAKLATGSWRTTVQFMIASMPRAAFSTCP